MAKPPANKTVSVISPAWNEAESLPKLVDRLTAALVSTGHDYEILIVENGSTDNSIDILRDISKKNTKVRYLKLSRNFGHQGALVAGLEHCRGDCAITIDADLQQPAELIPEMVRLWSDGYDVVYTTKNDARVGLVRKIGMFVFYRFISFVGKIKLDFGQSDFRLIDRKVIEVLKAIPEREKFLRGLIYWMGYRQTGIKYNVDVRQAGESKFSIGGLVKFAVGGILSFSLFPLRLFLYTGFLVSVICIFYGFAVVALKIMSLYNPELSARLLLPAGWTAVVYFVTLLGGLQLIGVGLLGEYLGKTLGQVKGRPAYIVSEDSVEAGSA